jgi:hypothetical protein
VAGRGFGRTTPSGTPRVQAPAVCSNRVQRGSPLAGGVRLLTPGGAHDFPSEASIVLGRDEGCDIALEDPLTSGRHARIVALDSGVVLEDLGSTNGVYLNGMRVNKRDRLHAGDRIVIGTTELSVFSLWIR